MLNFRPLVTLLTCTALTVPASGQTIGDLPYINAVNAWHDTHLLRHDAGEGPDAPQAGAPGLPEAPDRSGADLLVFEPDPEVTTEVNHGLAQAMGGEDFTAWPPALEDLAEGALSDRRFIELLSAPLGATEAEILEALESGALRAEHARALTEAGYSATDMGDVHAAFLIHAWAIVHDHAAPLPAGAYEAVRDTLARSLSAQRADVLELDEAELQQSAESFAVLTVLMTAAWQSAEGEDAQILRDGVAALCEGLGVDIRRVALTEAGFAMR